GGTLRYGDSSSAELFIESRIAATQVQSTFQPTFDDGDVQLSIDNPYLPAAAVALMRASNVTSVPFHRIIDEAGVRGTDNDRLMQQYVIGVDGTLPNRWTFEASSAYGITRESTVDLNDRDTARFLQSLESIRRVPRRSSSAGSTARSGAQPARLWSMRAFPATCSRCPRDLYALLPVLSIGARVRSRCRGRPCRRASSSCHWLPPLAAVSMYVRFSRRRAYRCGATCRSSRSCLSTLQCECRITVPAAISWRGTAAWNINLCRGCDCAACYHGPCAHQTSVSCFHLPAKLTSLGRTRAMSQSTAPRRRVSPTVRSSASPRTSLHRLTCAHCLRS